MRVRIVRFQGFTYKVTRNTVHRWDRITASWQYVADCDGKSDGTWIAHRDAYARKVLT